MCDGYRYIFILVIVFNNIPCFSQKEANNWYFGDKIGLTFEANYPKVLRSKMYAPQGSAVISDPESGELLFYTNGQTVWDRTHSVMPNGNQVAGDPGITQSALIVPYPRHSQLFYLFTLARDDGDCVKLYFSLIDLSENGGLGIVNASSKNSLLAECLTEKLTAIPHANGGDYWLIVHEASTSGFLVFLVSESGIHVPDVQKIGVEHPIEDGGRGYLKPSPDGSKLGCALFSINQRPFQIFDFDARTGVLSNVVSLGNFILQYGVSFSPDNTKVYLSGIDSLAAIDEDSRDLIFQFDLSSGNPDEIRLSKKGLFTNNPNLFPGGYYSSLFELQIGPNGKIYGAGSPARIGEPQNNSMYVINDPNKKDFLCDIKVIEFLFDSGSVTLGLPNFVETTFNGLTPSNNPNTSCFSSEDDFKIFPNPASDYLILSVPERCFESYRLLIYNTSGQLLQKHWIDQRISDPINVGLLAAGAYLVIMDFGKIKISKKLIKLKGYQINEP